MNERELKELPRNMDMVKKEFQKMMNLYYIQHDGKTNKEQLEDKALFFILLNEFYKFLQTIEESTTVSMKTLMEECNTNVVYFGKHNKKVWWDDDAKWFYIDDMSKKDYLTYDKEKNKEFLENR